MAQPMKIQPNYNNFLEFSQMSHNLDLFDSIPYKWVKKYNEDSEIEVEIIDLECDRVGWSKTQFNFTLERDCGPQEIKQEFKIGLEYNDSGYYANYIMEYLHLCVICNQHVDTRYADSNDEGCICKDCVYQEEEEEEEEEEEDIQEIIQPPQ